MKRKHLIKKIHESFVCQRTGVCCRQPGFVYLKGPDLARISGSLKLEPAKFRSEYCQDDEGRTALKANADHSCIFLKNNGCAINEVKPRQCRVFPYSWRDPESFDYCEGIRKLKMKRT